LRRRALSESSQRGIQKALLKCFCRSQQLPRSPAASQYASPRSLSEVTRSICSTQTPRSGASAQASGCRQRSYRIHLHDKSNKVEYTQVLVVSHLTADFACTTGCTLLRTRARIDRGKACEAADWTAWHVQSPERESVTQSHSPSESGRARHALTSEELSPSDRVQPHVLQTVGVPPQCRAISNLKLQGHGDCTVLQVVPIETTLFEPRATQPGRPQARLILPQS